MGWFAEMAGYPFLFEGKMIKVSVFDVVSVYGISAFEVVCRPSMAGKKHAELSGLTIHLSPAMYALYIHSEDKTEQDHLMKNIPVVVNGNACATINHVSKEYDNVVR